MLWFIVKHLIPGKQSGLRQRPKDKKKPPLPGSVGHIQQGNNRHPALLPVHWHTITPSTGKLHATYGILCSTQLKFRVSVFLLCIFLSLTLGFIFFLQFLHLGNSDQVSMACEHALEFNPYVDYYHCGHCAQNIEHSLYVYK